jgi:thiol:disulfide interchange protein DsbA
MLRRAFLLAACLTVALPGAACAQGGPSKWVEGEHYSLVSPVQRTNVAPGKVEVMEVFSYGCIACNNFQPALEQVKAALPANAQMVYLHAAFNAAENWPMLQRAYFTAQALGVAEKAHQGIYDAVWKTGELAVVDPTTGRLRSPQASILDAARVYSRLTGVDVGEFMKTADSFAVNAKVDAANQQILQMRVPGTPCFVIGGKYRIEMRAIRSIGELNELIRFLVEQEGGPAKPVAAAKPQGAAAKPRASATTGAKLQ